MWIIIAYLTAAVLLSPVSKKYPKLYIIIMCIGLIFISGYRSLDFGSDSRTYKAFFEMACNKSLNYHWHNFVTQADGKDPFYYLCNKLFSMVGGTFRGWLVLISAVYLSGVFHLISKYSKNFAISICLLSSFYLYFSMSGLRQTLAIGVTLWAFEMALARKPLRFLLLVALAAQFHSSAWICIIIYFLINIKFGAKNVLLISVSLLLSVVLPGTIRNLFTTLAWTDQYDSYASSAQTLSLSGFIIQALMLAFAVVMSNKEELKKETVDIDAPVKSYVKKIKKKSKEIVYKDENKDAMLNVMTIAICFQSMTIVTANIFRMAMYFSVGCLVAVPNTVEERPDGQDKYMWRIIIVIAAAVYMFVLGKYWQNFTMFGD